MARVVFLCTVAKAWQKGNKKLHICLHANSTDYFYDLLLPSLLAQGQVEYKRSTPPKSNLERQNQKWLDDQM